MDAVESGSSGAEALQVVACYFGQLYLTKCKYLCGALKNDERKSHLCLIV